MEGGKKKNAGKRQKRKIISYHKGGEVFKETI
jgi:hypothetical protein